MYASSITNIITTPADMPEAVALQFATQRVKDVVPEEVFVDLMKIGDGKYMVIAYTEDV